MDQANILKMPGRYPALLEKSREIGFGMSSDVYIGTLLKTLTASKPNGNFLELGTGIGLSLAWMIKGMDEKSQIISVDNDSELIQIANAFFHGESRLKLVCADGGAWLESYNGAAFDLMICANSPIGHQDMKKRSKN